MAKEETLEPSVILSQIRPEGNVQETEPIERGNRKQTALVRFQNQDPVVIQQSTDPETLLTEGTLLQRIADRTDVPVPRPIASGQHAAGSWLVTPYLSGDDLHESFLTLDLPIRREIVRAFGRYLAQLHEAFRFDRSGQLRVTDGTLRVQSTTPNAETPGGNRLNGQTGESWLARYARASVERLPDEFESIRPALLDTITSGVGTAATPRLFPWDFRPGNALLGDGELTGILDWEGPMAADPALSVAKSEYLIADWYVGAETRDSLESTFHAGYSEERPVPDVTPIHRIAAIASTAVDSRGIVTNPGYPPLDRREAVDFHRRALEQTLS